MISAEQIYDNLMKRLVIEDVKRLGSVCVGIDNADVAADDLLMAAGIFSKFHPAGCAGLAANQLGYSCRVFVIKKGNGFAAYINPKFVSSCRKVGKIEGCLSWPGKFFNAYRHREIFAWGDNQKKKLLTGMEAQAFQHELDHLNGVLI